MKFLVLFVSLSISLAFQTLRGEELLIKNSKSIWLEFSGQKSCQPGFCAESIPVRPLELALDFYQSNKHIIENDRYIGIIDYSKPSTEKRFWILNITNGSYLTMHVTHGKNSEGELAMAEKFSNVLGSEMSSLGFYVTDRATYFGKFGESIRLTGLSETNSRARERAIVIHAADYASLWFIENKGRLGLSQGCPAVSKENIQKVLTRMKGRTLLFGYHPQFEKNLAK